MRYLLLALLLSGSLQLSANPRPDQRIVGEIIVQLRANYSAERLVQRLQRVQPQANWQVSDQLGIRHAIYLLQFDEQQQAATTALQQVLRFAEVEEAQFNYVLSKRQEPNDPLFGDQPSLAVVNVAPVWNETTGGVTLNGDTIVAAILDFSFDRTHPDLRDNYWQNPGEIEGDGVDNDGNGYIDDVIGHDFRTSPPGVADLNHGTAVAGILGARGDNGIGVSGVNWQIKLMPLSVLSVDNIVAAYEYVIDQRRRYEETNGALGAFVVVTNASLGIENDFCNNFPIWRNMYDLLGAEGILSVSSATNAGQDVERFGDVPSTCPSEFLITVTDSGTEDDFNQSAGFGVESIDLSAPGDGSFSTQSDGLYGPFCCTSGAAPHVAGTVALLYSLPCQQLADDARLAPAALARQIKQAILDSTDPLAGLTGRSVSGGRLNAFAAMERIRDQCSTTPAVGNQLKFLEISPNPTSGQLRFRYQVPNFEAMYEVAVYDVLGRLILLRDVLPSRFSTPEEFITLPATLPLGIYVVSIRGAGEQVAQTFSLQP